MSLRAAVVGLGAMGRHHARILADLSGVDPCALVDRQLDRAEEHARMRDSRALRSVAELPAELDAVVVATPTVSHCEVAVPLLRRGVSCLVEKPMAATLEEADEMIRAAEEGGAVLFVGHAERFNPGLSRVRELISAPVFVESHRLGVFPERSLDVDVVLDLMIHDLDLLHWLTGSELEEVQAIGVKVLTPRVDIANARLTFGDGCTANVTASRVSAEITRKMRVFGKNRYVSIDFMAQSAEVLRLQAHPSGEDEPGASRGPGPAGARITCERFGPEEGEGREEPLRHELEAFLAAVRGERPPAVGGVDGRRALASALRVVKAMEAQREHRERARRAAT